MGERIIKKWLRLVIAFVMLLVTSSVTAQVISYSYDEAGNRIRREMIEIYDIKSDEENILPKDFLLINSGLTDISVSMNNEIQSICLTIPPHIEDGVAGELYSLAGYMMLRVQELEKNPNIKLSDIPKGVYVLIVRVGNLANAYKVIKQ